MTLIYSQQAIFLLTRFYNIFLFIGIKHRHEKLKELFQDDLQNWKMTSKISGDYGFNWKDRSAAFVDLTLIERTTVVEDTEHSDREYFWSGQDQPKKAIMLSSLVEKNDKFVVVRGIAGVGKTSLIDALTYKWSCGEVLPNIKFFLKLMCRDLNELKDESYVEEFLIKEYPEIFNLSVLQEVSGQVLIAVDGFDELKNNKDFLSIKRTHLLNSLHELISPKSKLLKNKHVLVFGRPWATKILLNTFSVNKLVEISGFSSKNVTKYLDSYFRYHKQEREAVQLEIDESEFLKAISVIPVYLSVIANIFESEKSVKELNTNTKLSTALFLIYLRAHTAKFVSKNLRDIANETDVKKLLIDLARFSYESLDVNKLVFDEDDFTDKGSLDLAQESGIIERTSSGADGDIFQFVHLTLQEYFAAMHLFITNMKLDDILQKPHMVSCLPILAGLEGFLLPDDDAPKYKTPKYMKKLVMNIMNKPNTEEETVINAASKYVINMDSKALSERFYSMFFEYQGCLSEEDTMLLQEQQLFLEVRHRHKLWHVIHYICKISPLNIMLDIQLSSHPARFNLSQLAVPSSSNIDWSCVKHLKLHKALAKVLPHIKYISTDAYTLDDESLLQSTSGVINKLHFTNYYNMDAISHIIPHSEKLVFRKCRCGPVLMNISSSHLFLSNLQHVEVVDCILPESVINVIAEWMPFVRSIKIKSIPTITVSSIKKINDSIVSAFDSGKLCLERLSLSNFNSEKLKVFTKCISLLKNLSLSCRKGLCCDSLTQMTNSIISAYDSDAYYLEKLSLMGCLLTDDHVRCLSPCIPYIKCLFIILQKKGLTSLSTGFISGSITAATENGKCLTEDLSLKYSYLDDEMVNNLCACIPYLNKLKLNSFKKLTFDSSLSNISKSIISKLKTNSCHIQSLNLSYCSLNDTAIEALKECIPLIKEIKLSGNHLCSKSMELICDSIIKAVKCGKYQLEDLILRNCHLYDQDFCLGDCIPYIKYLDICNNPALAHTAMTRISNSIMSAVATDELILRKLVLHNCNLSDEKIEALQPCIAYIRDLELGWNDNMTFRSITAVSNSIYKAGDKTRIEMLDMRHRIDFHCYGLEKKDFDEEKEKERKAVVIRIKKKLFEK